MGLDASTRLLSAPRWMFVIGGAAAMFCGQIIRGLLAIWSIGPVPSRLKPDGQLPCRYSVHGRASDDAIHRDARKAMAANSAAPSSADILMVNCRSGLHDRTHSTAWLHRPFQGHHLARSHSAFCRFRHRSEKEWETNPLHIPHSCGCKHNGIEPSVPQTEVSSGSCAAAAFGRKRLPTRETWRQKGQHASINGPNAKDSEFLPHR